MPAMLAASEIVTNALLHGAFGEDGTIELLITTHADIAIIAIANDAATAPTKFDLEAVP